LLDWRRCFRCQGLGHITSECLNKGVFSSAEYHASFKKLKEEKEGGDKGLYLNDQLKEIEKGSDEGELPVIHRALSGLATQDAFKQIEVILHTRTP